jgi:hypothetical protein
MKGLYFCFRGPERTSAFIGKNILCHDFVQAFSSASIAMRTAAARPPTNSICRPVGKK